MTPGARIAAAIGILDRILAGEAPEQVITNWGRASRYAGSGDRSAVRDLVYDALRQRRSLAALGGSDSGRGLMLGRLRAAGLDPATLFTGLAHAPEPPRPEETGRLPSPEDALDLPDWIIAAFAASLGEKAAPVALSLRERAPVFLRVNLAKGTRDAAVEALAGEAIRAVPHPLATTALEVIEGQRRIQTSAAYREGLVELQDAASQAVIEALPLGDGMKVLDHCAGGGGKSLAMAARAEVQLFAHDALPARMRDLPARAARSGARIRLTRTPEADGPYDLVLADVPCSGSGSWRRDPAGKWRLTPEALAGLLAVQAGILDRVAPMVRAGGTLAYATCSLLEDENGRQIAGFRERHPGWPLVRELHLTPLEGGDGFYLAILRRS